jgi:soluble lytic murein transglycosylase-like protein
MPTVERVSAPTVAPEPLPGARVHAYADPNAASGLIRGIDTLGGSAAGLAKLEQDKAETAQLLEAQRKLGDWERTWFDPNNQSGIYGKKGRDALGLVDEIDPEFQRVQNELAGSIKGERARQAFLQHATVRRDSMLDRVNGYVVNQHDEYVANEFKAGLLNTTEEAAQAAVEGRWQDQTRLVADGLRIINQQAVLNGQPPEVTQQQASAFVSSIHATAANGMLARGEAMAAASYVDANADDINASTMADLMARLRPHAEEDIATRILNGFRGGQAPVDLDMDLDTRQLWEHVEHRESRSQQSAVSPKGAVGVAQIMPATGPIAARYAGLPWDEKRFKTDPDYNRALGQAYLAAQMQTFGAPALALAAYNAGPGAVEKWINRIGDPRAGEISMAQFVAAIPYKETREYVQAIMGRAGKPVMPPDTAPRAPAMTADTGAAPLTVGTVSMGPLVAVDGAVHPTAPQTPVQRLAADLARVRAMGLPAHVQERIEAGLKGDAALAEAQERDQEQEVTKAIHLAVETVAPGTPLSSALTPDQYTYAAQNNLLPALEQRVADRAKGTPRVTPPDLEAATSEVLYHASMGAPEAVAEVLKINAYNPRLPYSDADRARIATVQAAIKKGDKATLAAQASDGEITQTIQTYRRNSLGITDDQTKNDPEKAAITANFNRQMRTYVSDYSAAHGGKKPNYRELQEHADQLVLADVPAKRERSFWFDSEDKAPAAAIVSVDQVPERYLILVRDAFRARGVANPSEQQVLDLYLRTARAGKLPP